MKRTCFLATIVFFLIGLSCLATNAFRGQERAALNGYAIQITYKDGKFSHTPMYGQELKGKTSFTLSPWTMIKRAAKASDQVSLVKVAAAFDSVAWKIQVTVVKGEFYDDGEELAATYQVREGDKLRIDEMDHYGIEPFEVSIVRVNERAAVQPDVINKTSSIGVLNLEATVLPKPYRLWVNNLSHKRVLALEVNTYKDGQKLFLRWLQGTWDRPLIEAGGTYEIEVTSAGRGQASSSGYWPEQSMSIEINTVVFEDETYEGGAYLAAVTKGQRLGHKLQLQRVIPQFERPTGGFNNLGMEALIQLKKEVSTLNEDVDPKLIEELQAQFQMLNTQEKSYLINFAKSGMHQVKTSLLKDVAEFERSVNAGSNTGFKAWLARTNEKYGQWLSGL